MGRSVFVVFLYFFTCVFSIIKAQNLYEGDACTIGSTGQPGLCTLFPKCQELFTAFHQKGQIPETTCSYLQNDPIICCPNGEIPTTPKPKPSGRGKSYDMCKKYSQSVWEVKASVGLSLGAKPDNTSQCGYKIQALVVGGTKADPREFPHMALVGYGDRNSKQWSCGGSLISENFVLTAAHCLYHSELDQDAKYVRLGDLNTAKDIPRSEDPKDFDIIASYQPDKPDNYDPPQYYNDIALLKLKESVVFNMFIRPACLYKDPVISTKKAIATGWGLTGFAGESSDDLMKVTLDIISNPACNARYQVNKDELPLGIVDRTQFCAGGLKKDTCNGDSGGPIQIYTPQEEFFCMYYLLGVTSFGKACGIQNSAGVYSRIAPFVPWIEKIVWPHI